MKLFRRAAFVALVLTGCSTTERNTRPLPPSNPVVRRTGFITWAPERDPELRVLLKARYDAAVSAYKTERALLDSGGSTIGFVLRLADLVVEAETAKAETPEGVIQALEEHLNTISDLESAAKRMIRLGPLPPFNGENLTRCWRLAAELDLLRAKHYFERNHSK